MTVSASDFPAFFEALWDYPPFPWQAYLAKQVCACGWPRALDLPTASGKTAAIDIALFHLAVEADRGKQRTAPVRICFVVDRRLVVDGAYDRAGCIAKKLTQAEEGILRRVADGLRRLAGDAEPLRAVRLRGGAPMEPDWVRSPAQPTIVVSTVDQVGSRLLFRGYGVSDSMRPVHAGLLGSDALFLLDEAHLSEPFVETLDWVRRYQGPQWVEQSAVPFGVVHLSATLAPGDTVSFRLREEDRAHAVLGRRLTARKLARLAKAKARLQDEPGALAGGFADQALELAERDPSARVVAIVVNRVALARLIQEIVLKRLQDTDTGREAEVTLLTGRSRPLDRERLLKEVLPRMAAGRAAEEESRRLYVVATQCVEAGADLDFDALVTQLAPLDSLRQRFGRLDRLGRRGESQAVIFAAADEVGKAASDPIYGASGARTWDWLNVKAERKGKVQPINFGVSAMDALLTEVRAGAADGGTSDLATLLAPRSFAPVMLPAYLDAFAHTWPAPGADPEVALFLHGPQAAPPDVQIVWRADLGDDLGDPEAAREIVAFCPPSSLEAIAVPIGAARAWLRHAPHGDDVADVEGVTLQGSKSEPHTGRRALRWRGADNSGRVSPDELRPGDLIVVPSSYGGCDGYGWNPSRREAVDDLAFAAQLRHRGRLILRLHPALLRQQPWRPIADLLFQHHDAKAQLLDALADLDDLPEDWRRAIRRLSDSSEVIDLAFPYGDPERGAILSARHRLSAAAVRDLLGEQVDDAAEPATEGDIGLFGSAPTALLEHCADVEQRARGFAERAGLPAERVEAIALAARLHDLGKAEQRFQTYLRGGDELAWLADPRLLAKSGARASLADIRRAARLARMPAGTRHECWSVRLAERHPGIDKAHDPDLVLWLIGTHHGRGRPFFPPVVDDAAEGKVMVELGDGARLEVAVDHGLTRLDSGWVERFERLNRRYGPWELARMEAILRIADHRASEQESLT